MTSTAREIDRIPASVILRCIHNGDFASGSKSFNVRKTILETAVLSAIFTVTADLFALIELSILAGSFHFQPVALANSRATPRIDIA